MLRLLALALLCPGFNAARGEPSALRRSAACLVAVPAADYGPAARGVPVGVMRQIEAYRGRWREACLRGRIDDMPGLYGTAQGLAGTLLDAFPDHPSAARDAVLPFVPLVRCGRVEGGESGDVECSADAEGFAWHAAYGSARDRRFFQARREARAEWSRGRCALFGEFDWTGHMRRLEGLEKAARAPAYREEARERRKEYLGFFERLSARRRICACGGNEGAVLPDLERLRASLKGWRRRAARGTVEELLRAVRSGDVSVEDEREDGCADRSMR